ncbi:MAG TPA: Gfo/Idh/MocA family oxidoreductase [Anaeromyxobacteraceae bacterium]|nr:Gfo/Idh/MocA family oxidoreductase [Anaeromyxobacteraceae bacterium]
MKPVVWGVLGTARIATEKVIPGMRGTAACELRAIASRSAEAARRAAAALGIPVAYGSYEALLADPAIEAVYIPVPNQLHVELSLAAARAGKHVLCEKPIALDAAEARRLAEAAGRVRIMEAFMVRFHPQWLRVRELVRAGRVGRVMAVQTFFSFFNEDPANIRNRPETGGGALYDVGCYASLTARWVFEAEPRRAVALVDRDPRFRTDRMTSGLVDFGEGRHLTFTVSTQSARYQRVQVCGPLGRIEVRVPFNAPQGGAMRLLLDDGSELDDAAARVETLPEADQYALQVQAFSRAVRGEIELPFGVEDAVSNMRVLDALFRSERTGRWEDV